MRTFIFLLLTNKCNRNCDYCLIKDMLNKTEDTLKKEVLFNYLSYLHKGDVVEITGGEPTLIPWLEELVQYLNGKEVYTVLRTNGYKLFKNKYKWLLVVLNTHDENEEYAKEKESLLRDTDIVLGKTVPHEYTAKDERLRHDAPPMPKEDRPDLTHKQNDFDNARMIGHQGHVWYMLCEAEKAGNHRFKLGETLDDYIDVDQTLKPCGHCPFIIRPWSWVHRLGLEGEVPENDGFQVSPDRPYDKVIQKRMEITKEYQDKDVYVYLSEENERLIDHLFRHITVRGCVAEDSDIRVGSWINGNLIISRSKFDEIASKKEVVLYA